MPAPVIPSKAPKSRSRSRSSVRTVDAELLRSASCAVLSGPGERRAERGGRPLVLGQLGQPRARAPRPGTRPVSDSGTSGSRTSSSSRPDPACVGLRVGDVAHALAVPHQPQRAAGPVPVAHRAHPRRRGRRCAPSATPVAAGRPRRNRDWTSAAPSARWRRDPADRPSGAGLRRPAADFEAWLEAEHDRGPGLYVKIAKKGAGIPSVTAAELVESALCFGWIDGRGNRLTTTASPAADTPRGGRRACGRRRTSRRSPR